jgi:predicted metalloprotease
MLPLIFWLLRTPFGWVVILVGLVYFLFTGALGGGTSGHRALTEGARGGGPASESKLVHFVSFVLDDTQSTWSRVLPAQTGVAYRHAKLVLFTDSTQTGCGYVRAATGPFYCPADERVYLDLGFYQELSDRLGAGGELAQAYVVAHEVGHHVQNILGISEKVAAAKHPTGESGASVRLELQADCFAGIWAHETNQRGLLEKGDIESALGAAQAIGDDRLQRMQSGTVSPERWTHGSSAQRVKWFKRGYDQGSIEQCDTFAVSEP